MSYNTIKQSIDDNIKQNGKQQITGPVLNTILTELLKALGDLNLRQYVYISVAPTLNTLNEIETLTIPAQSVYLNGTAANVPVQNSVIQLSSNWNYQHIIFNATTKAFSAASAQARKPWLEENEYYAGTIRKSGANGKWSFITWNGNTFSVNGVEYSQSAPIETRYLYSATENEVSPASFVAGNIVQFRKSPSDMGTISILFDTNVNENLLIYVGTKSDGSDMSQIATIPGALAGAKQYLFLDDYNRDALYISIRCGSSYSADIHYSVQFIGSSINSVYRRTYLPLKNAFINKPPILNSEEGTITFPANTAVYCEGMSNYIALGREITLTFVSGYKFTYIYYYADCNSFLITNIQQFKSEQKKFKNIFHVATLRVQNGDLKPYFIKLNATSAVIDGTTYKCFLPESDANLAQKLNALQNKVDNNIAHWFVSSNEPPIFDAVNRHLTVPAQLMYVMGRQFRTTKSLEVDLPTGQNLYWVKLQYNSDNPDDSVLIAGRVAEAVPVLGDNEYYYCMVRLSSNGDCSIFTINAISFIIRRGTTDILCESKSLAGNIELMNSLKEVSSYVQFRPGNVTSTGVLNTGANYAVSDLIPISEGQGIKEIFIKKRDNFIFATRAAKFLSGWDINGNYVNVSIPVIKADDKTGVVSFYYDQSYRFIRVVCDNKKATATFLKHEAASIIAIGDAPGYDYRGNFSRAYAATNPKLDYRKDTFCVLDIGNSYTNDSTRVLPDIFSFFKTKFNLDYSKTVLYKLTRPSASFASHCDIYAGKDTQPYQIVKVAGDYNIGLADQTGIPGTNKQPFRDALQKYPWDLILIHQASNYSNDYALWQRNSDSGRLHQLVLILQRCCPQATIGQLLVHSYAGSDSRNTEGSTELRWLHNAQAAKQLSENYGIDFIVPYGTAVENLRRTSLNNAYDLTRDGTHLGFGHCQFAAACSYWQSVFAPRFNKSVIELATGGFTLPDPGDSSWTGNSAIPVTTNNSSIGAYAGLWACTNAFSLHNPQKETTETL